MEDGHAKIAEQIVEGLSSGVVAVDGAGKIVIANEAARTHLNLAVDALLPGARFDAVDGVSTLLEVMEQVRATGVVVRRHEVVLETPQGARTLGMNVSPLSDDGRETGFIFLFTDLTEVKRLERAAEVNRQLAQIGELTAGVVHELRNPLSVVSGMAELLMRGLDGEPQLRERAEAIFSEATQMGKLITQFLGFARPYEIQACGVTLKRIVDRSQVLCTELARARGVLLDTESPEEEILCHLDIDALVHAVGNILRNAIEATGEGGRVCFRAEHHGDTIEFHVTDEGPGIHLAPGEDLFSPFFSKREGGTGLGLSIAQRAVSAHGGSIEYANRSTGGARFSIILPVRAVQPETVHDV